MVQARIDRREAEPRGLAAQRWGNREFSKPLCAPQPLTFRGSCSPAGQARPPPTSKPVTSTFQKSARARTRHPVVPPSLSPRVRLVPLRLKTSGTNPKSSRRSREPRRGLGKEEKSTRTRGSCGRFQGSPGSPRLRDASAVDPGIRFWERPPPGRLRPSRSGGGLGTVWSCPRRAGAVGARAVRAGHPCALAGTRGVSAAAAAEVSNAVSFLFSPSLLL